uniref:Uncharacterized protein n=1 Tax=Tetradesmus obliquus TaxID=3088 RepID=A0A383VWB6_TETOB
MHTDALAGRSGSQVAAAAAAGASVVAMHTDGVAGPSGCHAAAAAAAATGKWRLLQRLFRRNTAAAAAAAAAGDTLQQRTSRAYVEMLKQHSRSSGGSC